jgi:hypothetical protein
LNVGSGGGAAAAPAAGGAAAGGDAAAEEAKEEEKAEGKDYNIHAGELVHRSTDSFYRKGRVRRGYGLWSLRLSSFDTFPVCTFQCMATVFFPTVQIGWSSSFP